MSKNYTINLSPELKPLIKEIKKILEAKDPDNRNWYAGEITAKALKHYFNFLGEK